VISQPIGWRWSEELNGQTQSHFQRVWSIVVRSGRKFLELLDE
jgi:hypothetical protein